MDSTSTSIAQAVNDFRRRHLKDRLWLDISTAPEGRAIWTKIDDGDGVRNVQVMTRRGRLWFAGDVYAYYTPTHWRE